MADLLGDILGNMETVPSVPISAAEKALRSRKEKAKEVQKKERDALARKRDEIHKLINAFVQSGQRNKTFPTMNKIERAIVHEIAQDAGLISQAFGKDEFDRHIVIWNKDTPPSEAELIALRKGDAWDPSKLETNQTASLNLNQHLSETHHTKANDTFEHPVKRANARISKSAQAPKTAARATSANEQYGCVPSSNKRDNRTIEQILADNKSKRQKLQQKTDTNR